MNVPVNYWAIVRQVLLGIDFLFDAKEVVDVVLGNFRHTKIENVLDLSQRREPTTMLAIESPRLESRAFIYQTFPHNHNIEGVSRFDFLDIVVVFLFVF